jgi:hypothetical protein
MADTDKNSPAFSLNLTDVMVIGKNALLVAVAAGLTYVVENMGHLDLGATGVMLVPVVTVVINTIVKWAKNNVPAE